MVGGLRDWAREKSGIKNEASHVFGSLNPATAPCIGSVGNK